MEKIQNAMGREMFRREHKQYIEDKEINQRIFETDPFKYISNSKIVKGLLFNHLGFVNKVISTKDELELLVGEFKFKLPKQLFPGVCGIIREKKLVAFPLNVKTTNEQNVFTLKYDEFLALVDDDDSLSAVREVS